MPKVSPSHRLKYLDSLRGFAAISVLMSHLILGFGLPSNLAFTSATPLHFFWHGSGAVTFFFLLSGFVLALPYFNSSLQSFQFSFVPYAIKRVFRIVPLLLCSLILSLAAREWLFRTYRTIPPATDWFLYFWRTPLSIKEILGLVPQAWTLGIELPASLLIPIVAMLSKRKAVWLLTFTYLLIFRLNLNPYILDFAVGICIAQYYKYFADWWLLQRQFSKWSLLIIGILLYTAEFYLPLTVMTILAHLRLQPDTFGTALFLLFALSSVKLQRFLSIRFFIWVGKLSYSIYLIHFIVFLTFIPWFLSEINQIGIIDQYLTRILSAIAFILVTLSVSQITYFLVERPWIDVGKMVGSWPIWQRTKFWGVTTNF